VCTRAAAASGTAFGRAWVLVFVCASACECALCVLRLVRARVLSRACMCF
jgi:hypothetical protein